METKPVIHVIGTRIRPKDEEKYNTWYNEIHIPMLIDFKGLEEVTRYKIIHETEEYPKYLAIYKFESQEAYEAFITGPEFTASMEERKETWPEGGSELKWRVQYEMIRTWKK